MSSMWLPFFACGRGNPRRVRPFDLQPESFADLCDQFMDLFLAKLGECPLASGSRELLGQIKASGKTQSVLSATEQGSLHDVMSQFGLEGRPSQTYERADDEARLK